MSTEANEQVDDELYVCFDTCAIIDCAYARIPEASASLLKRVFDVMDERGVKLLIPEVVLSELELVEEDRRRETEEGLYTITDKIDELSRQGVLHGEALKNLRKSVKDARAEIAREADGVISDVRKRSKDSGRSRVLPFGEREIHQAVTLALSGAKPAKNKTKYGLLQGDCLIAACVKSFVESNAGATVVLCSSNTRDFAVGSDDGSGECALHPELDKLWDGRVKYCKNPVALLKGWLEQHLDEDEERELDDAFERSSAASRETVYASAFVDPLVRYGELSGELATPVWEKVVAAASQLSATNALAEQLGRLESLSASAAYGRDLAAEIASASETALQLKALSEAAQGASPHRWGGDDLTRGLDIPRD